MGRATWKKNADLGQAARLTTQLLRYARKWKADDPSLRDPPAYPYSVAIARHQVMHSLCFARSDGRNIVLSCVRACVCVRICLRAYGMLQMLLCLCVDLSRLQCLQSESEVKGLLAKHAALVSEQPMS